MPFSANEALLLHVTPQRARILALIAQHYREPEIATHLVVSVSTVHSHIRQLRNLTGCESMDEMGRWWVDARPRWLELMERAAHGQ